MYQIVIGARFNGNVKTLPGAHMIAKMHSENDAAGQHVYVYEASDVTRSHLLGMYLNGVTLIKLDD